MLIWPQGQFETVPHPPFAVDFSCGLRLNTAILLRTSTFIRKALP
jgi:hypothetical protein